MTPIVVVGVLGTLLTAAAMALPAHVLLGLAWPLRCNGTPRSRNEEDMDITIEEHVGSHREVAWSFREAEDSEELLERYIDLGRVWVAVDPAGRTVGHLQAVPRDDSWEVTNTAVLESERGRGIGRALLERAVEEARSAGVRRMVLATATADIGNLRFYQRCGFRLTHVVHDVFTQANGYPPGLEVDGIPLLDQVWFERAL